MDIEFKNAGAEDIEEIYKLEKKLIEDYETEKGLDFEKVFAWVRRKIEKNIGKYKCIYFDGAKAGYFCLNDGDKMELDDLFVFEKYRNRGIGTEVLKYAASAAGSKGKGVYLYVFAKNRGAANLYLKNGYKIVKKVSESRYIMSM